MPEVSRRHLGRRKVLVAVAAAAAGGGLGPARAAMAAARRRGGPRRRERLEVPAAAAFSLLGHPLRAGEPLAHGCVEAVLPLAAGAVPVVMRTPAGARFQVDVLRRDPDGPRGVAETERFSLFIANQGDGRTPTDEAQAHAARSLAAWLAAREAGAPAPALRSFAERAQAGAARALWRGDAPAG
jgi:hypothetical protein